MYTESAHTVGSRHWPATSRWS